MVSITERIAVSAPPDPAWAALRDVGHPHHVLLGILTDARLDGDGPVVASAVVATLES